MQVRNNVAKAGFDNIIIPDVYEELCTRKLLVMEEVVPATPLHNALDNQAALMAKQKGISKQEFLDQVSHRVFLCDSLLSLADIHLQFRTAHAHRVHTCIHHSGRPPRSCCANQEKARVEAEARRLAKEGRTVEAISAEDYDKYIKLQKARRGLSRALK